MIKERVIQLIENKGIAKESFFEKIGMTSANFRGKAKETPLNSTAIENILSEIKDTNPEWLLTGKGDMLKRNKPQVTNLQNGIPLVYQTAIGGFGNNHFTLSDRDVKEYYVIPKFKHKHIDFMIEVEGSSMYPKYNSGDVVACKIIKEDTFLQWNKTHVVATKDQGIIIKRIKKGNQENTLCMISDNNSYDPFEVPKDEITGIALVVGVIRLE